MEFSFQWFSLPTHKNLCSQDLLDIFHSLSIISLSLSLLSFLLLKCETVYPISLLLHTILHGWKHELESPKGNRILGYIIMLNGSTLIYQNYTNKMGTSYNVNSKILHEIVMLTNVTGSTDIHDIYAISSFYYISSFDCNTTFNLCT